jgi:protease-4
MKKGKYVLIIFLIIFVLFTATIISFFLSQFQRTPTVKPHSYLSLKLAGPIEEKASPNIITSFFTGRTPLSMFDIWQSIRKAKKDERIKGILLRLGYMECDWAKAAEIRDSLLDFRTSGKKVYAYIEETLDFDKEYYLATACDRIVLHPLSTLVINGIGGQVPFLKKALDKLGIEAESEQVEEFKAAFSMFTEEGFTPAHKRMMESLYGDIFDHYIQILSETRGKTEEEIRALIDYGFFGADRALEEGLVDDLLYEDEVFDLLKEDGQRISLISHAAYKRIKPSSVGLGTGKKIALIYAMGPIYTGEGAYQAIGSGTYARWIRRARKDKSIAALVLRVDSPGGSGVGSDIIWREVFLTKKEKPVVVSMSDVAGSGGYWISMDAHRIFAHPQTLTGSIGVVFGKFNLAGLLNKIGVTSETIRYGKHADMFSFFRRMTPEEKSIVKTDMRRLYDAFLTKVALGRDMTKEEVDNIGRGRVWSGLRARDIGLIDELGGLSAAIEAAKELAGIDAREEVKLDVLPKKISFWDLMFGRRLVRSSLPLRSKWDKAERILHILEKDPIWAIMPLWSIVR